MQLIITTKPRSLLLVPTTLGGGDLTLEAAPEILLLLRAYLLALRRVLLAIDCRPLRHAARVRRGSTPAPLGHPAQKAANRLRAPLRNRQSCDDGYPNHSNYEHQLQHIVVRVLPYALKDNTRPPPTLRLWEGGAGQLTPLLA